MAKETENRKCVLTGNILPKEDLLRFILLKDGTVLPDFNKKLDGRGFYLSNSKKLLSELSAKTNPLNKILHTKTIMSADLPQIVEKILHKRGLDALNLARKAGDLVLGFEKVKDVIAKGKAAFVIEATDAGDDGRQKVAVMARDLETFILYDVASLSAALNRENTVYLAVKKSPMSTMVRSAFQRYHKFLNE
ncbi:MAG: DUF448 domain-containing protein [Alphaproteobacteria bacterium]|nr:DUF448 domain-containing protein [Alphaproteobacteria bacterium]